MEPAAIITVILFFGVIASAIYLIIRHEKKLLAEKIKLAEQLGAQFEARPVSFLGMKLEEIEILEANASSLAQSLIYKKDDRFDSFHFNFSKTHNSRSGSGSVFAALFRLKQSSLPHFRLFPNIIKADTLKKVHSVFNPEEELFEVAGTFQVGAPKGTLSQAEAEKLLSFSIPSSISNHFFTLKGEGEWIYISTRTIPASFESWHSATIEIVNQIIRNSK